MAMTLSTRDSISTSHDIYNTLKASMSKLERHTSDLDLGGENADRYGVSTVSQPAKAGRGSVMSKASARSRASRASRSKAKLQEEAVKVKEENFEFRFSKVVYDYVKGARGDRRGPPSTRMTSKSPLTVPLSEGDLENEPRRKLSLLSYWQNKEAAAAAAAAAAQVPAFVRDVTLYQKTRIDLQTVPRDSSFVWEPIDQNAHPLTPIFTPVARRRRRSTIGKKGTSMGSLYSKRLSMAKESRELAMASNREDSDAALPLPEYDSDEDEVTRAMRQRRDRLKKEKTLYINARKLRGAAYYFNWDSAPNTPESPITSFDKYNPVLPGILLPEPPRRRGRKSKKMSLSLPARQGKFWRNHGNDGVGVTSMAKDATSLKTSNENLNKARAALNLMKPSSDLHNRRQALGGARKAAPTLVVRKPVRLPPIAVKN